MSKTRSPRHLAATACTIYHGLLIVSIPILQKAFNNTQYQFCKKALTIPNTKTNFHPNIIQISPNTNTPPNSIAHVCYVVTIRPSYTNHEVTCFHKRLCLSASDRVIYFCFFPQSGTGWSKEQTEIRLLIFMGGETTGARSSILHFSFV